MIFLLFLLCSLCPSELQLWSASLSAWNSQEGRAEMGIPACALFPVKENHEIRLPNSNVYDKDTVAVAVIYYAIEELAPKMAVLCLNFTPSWIG